jgi:drug/metabolite transporter (DMT)-like permease
MTMTMWAGNTVLARYVTGDVPPLGLTLFRWILASAIILPFGWAHLKRDWPDMVQHWKAMLVLAATGVVGFNALNYYGLQYTTALNGVLLHSSTPLMIALMAFLLFRDRLGLLQAIGIATSFCGVLVIISRGELGVLFTVSFNQGDLWIMAGLFCNAIFASCLRLRPQVHWLGYLTATSLLGVILTLPLAIGEMAMGIWLEFNTTTVVTLIYVAVGASLVAHLCFNRGVELIGSNRAGAFFHVHPVIGAVMAIGLLGEELRFYHLVGFALTMTGVALAARKPRVSAHRQRDAGPAPRP